MLQKPAFFADIGRSRSSASRKIVSNRVDLLTSNESQLTISDDALLTIGRMVMDGGRWNGEEVLPEGWLRTMLRPSHQLGQNVHYGNLWWFSAVRSQRGFEGAVMMKGNGGNIVALVPTMDAVLVVQSESYNRAEAERNSFIALTSMLRSLPVPEG